MRPLGRVAQITPYPVSHHGEDVPIGRQASHQESALDAGRNLGGNIARALITDGELALFHTIADHVLKPIEMHLGKSVQTRLHWR
jgi:hypothetical protein